MQTPVNSTLAFKRYILNKSEILKQIQELVDQQENAIMQHPVEIVDVYIMGRDAFIEGQSDTDKNQLSGSMPITFDELSLMHRYMLSSSFISAWYHLKGEKANRDKAAHSCSILVASLGPEPELVMKKYIEYEQLWRSTMKDEGVAPRSFRIFGFFIVLAIIVGVLIIFFTK